MALVFVKSTMASPTKNNPMETEPEQSFMCSYETSTNVILKPKAIDQPPPLAVNFPPVGDQPATWVSPVRGFIQETEILSPRDTESSLLVTDPPGPPSPSPT